MKKTILFFIMVVTLLSCKESEAIEPTLAKPFLSVDMPQSTTVTASSKSKVEYIKVTTNIKWEVVVDESYDWFAVETVVGEKDNRITLTISENTDLDRREGSFIVRGDGVPDISISVVQIGQNPDLIVDQKYMMAPYKGEVFKLNITATVEYTISLSSKLSWVKVGKSETKAMVSSDYNVVIDSNPIAIERNDTIVIVPIDPQYSDLTVKIPISQDGSPMDQIIPSDINVLLQSVELTRGNTYGQEVADLSMDGEYRTHYSSSSTPQGDSIVLDYAVSGTPNRIDLVKLVQRVDQNAGSIFTSGSVWYKSASQSDWAFAGVIDVEAGSTALVDVNIDKPTHIRVAIRTKVGSGAVALAEIELWEIVYKGDISEDLKFFEDDSYSKLKSSTTINEIHNISNPLLQTIARELLNRTYENNFRAKSYKSQRTPWVVSGELKIGSQSHYDNPTGIFFKEGVPQHVFVGANAGAPVTLVVADFRDGGGTERVALVEGFNSFTPKVSGSGYIQYYTDGVNALPNVNIHFAYGNEVGFWDIRNGDTKKEFDNMLSMAEKCFSDQQHTNGMITVLGEKAQLINSISAFRQHCPDVEKTIAIHDRILEIEYTMMGLVANNAVPVNRKLNLRSWSGLPNWGGNAAKYPNSEAEMVNDEVLINSLWVFGHELGHGNQINPHMKMTGWGETTNNVYSASIVYELGNRNNLRLEHEVISRKQGDTEPGIIGGRYNAYLNEAHVVKEPYLTHEGPDYLKGSANGKGLRGDHFVKLIPLWQMTLYFEIAGEGNSWHTDNFWGPINWKAINDDRTNLSNGEMHVNFMKSCMESGNADLSDFFETIGLLRVTDRWIDDYAVGELVITQDQVDDVKRFGAQYDKPRAKISYISANSVDAYRGQVGVEGTVNEGVAPKLNGTGVGLLVDHNIWKNVTVFETYRANELIDISMVGSGSNNNTTTYVRYPEGSTRLEAVAYDGTRTLVYGIR